MRKFVQPIMSFSQQCHQEILELHQALEDWLGGKIEIMDNLKEQKYKRIVDLHSDNFTYIVPEGELIHRDKLFNSLKKAYGVKGNNFKIWIKNIQTLFETNDFCVLIYEEWQKSDRLTGRQSTAFFQQTFSTPNGLELIHIHETWLLEDKIIDFTSNQ
jgi:hypothetical protein